MAYTIADGRPGLDGIFTINGVAINDLSTLPQVKLDELTGYYDAPDADDSRAKKTGRIGETVAPISENGKTVTLAGTVRARSQAELRTYIHDLQLGLREHSAEQFVTVTPPAATGGIEWGFNARVMAPSPQIPEQQQQGPTALPSPWQRQFTLALRMSDPRFYVTSEHIDETTTDIATGVTVTNEGTAPSDPAIILGGVVSGTPCSVWSGGKRLDFVAPTASGFLAINFLNRTATISGVEQSGHIEAFTSTWWDPNVQGLEPGVAETIKASGCTSLQVQAYHAAW